MDKILAAWRGQTPAFLQSGTRTVTSDSSLSCIAALAALCALGQVEACFLIIRIYLEACDRRRADVVLAPDYTSHMTEGKDGLPLFARIRIGQATPRGCVEAIRVRPARLAPVVELETWDLRSDADHGRSSRRAVTLFQHEHLSVLESLLRRPVEFSQTRRTLSVRGLNLEVARGAVLKVGATLLQVTGRCHPCARMDETLGRGGFVAMFGHGGWTASVVQTGTIRRGDVVQLHAAPNA